MDGLRFTCQPGCINCCNHRGFVYLTEEDLESAAAWLGMTPDDFERRYVFRTRRLRRLRKPPDRQCPFLLQDGCRIHPAKPTQCRLYPFWPELVKDRRMWRAESRRCPGIGTGPLVQIGTALEMAAGMPAAYPSLYDGQPNPRLRQYFAAKSRRNRT